MAIEYLGLSNINGPLVVLEGLQDAFYDEIVEFVVDGNKKKMGRIIELYEGRASSRYLKEREYVPGKYTYQIIRTPDGSGSVTGYAGKNI